MDIVLYDTTGKFINNINLDLGVTANPSSWYGIYIIDTSSCIIGEIDSVSQQSITGQKYAIDFIRGTIATIPANVNIPFYEWRNDSTLQVPVDTQINYTMYSSTLDGNYSVFQGIKNGSAGSADTAVVGLINNQTQKQIEITRNKFLGKATLN